MTALPDLLAREDSLLAAFVAALKAEQEALTAGTAEALPALGEKKMAVVEQLNGVAAERNAWLQAAGLQPDHGGISVWLERHRSPRPVADQWRQLLARAAEARQLNEANGRLIAMRLHMTNEALEVLTQQARFSNLYGADGQAATRGGSRIIDAA